ncbi:TadE/TadG family type IV pilus assembly protein [Nonomuraea diastatica]|uniref:Pilus assembly protein n=1 Tax=Nonomuraea diastatica TaxID=1848329 RepID=A0A4R4W3Q8_9ACTN|nr:TadE/TadG family type IV pilus assembly protein [Nonomuraea diastatica]TDD13162.1 pilus assembly protein [Nonomuraea diastatica]
MNVSRRERGNVVIETVLIFPPLLLLILAAIVAGRIVIAHAAVEAAARDAARQASLARTPLAAQQAALTSAASLLQAESLHCAPQVHIDTTGFGAPVGSPATVSARVTCTVALGDVTIPGMPGSKTITANFTSPLDPFRGRS